MAGGIRTGGAIHLARQSQIVGSGAMRDGIAQSGGMIVATAGLLLAAVVGWSASPLAPIRDWGEVASVAVITNRCAGPVRCSIADVALADHNDGNVAGSPHCGTRSAGWWSKRPAWQSLGVMAVITAAAFGLRQTNLELDLLHGLPAKSNARQAITAIESQLAGSILSESIIRLTPVRRMSATCCPAWNSCAKWRRSCGFIPRSRDALRGRISFRSRKS